MATKDKLPTQPHCSAGSAAVREALELAEDVLSRAPFSTGFWPNGMHPQTGIDKIRDAIRSLNEPQAVPVPKLLVALQHTLTVMKKAHASEDRLMSIWGSDIAAIEQAIATLSLPRPQRKGDQ